MTVQPSCEHLSSPANANSRHTLIFQQTFFFSTAQVLQSKSGITNIHCPKVVNTPFGKAFWASSAVHVLSTATGAATFSKLPEPNRAVRRGVISPTTPNEIAASWDVPRGWFRISIAELLTRGLLLDVKDGNHGSNHPRSIEFVEHGTPFLMASDIQDGRVIWDTASHLGTQTISRLRVGFSKPGDVLFTHKASIGKTAITDRECILSPQVTYYRCNSDYIESRWLQVFLGSSLFLSQLTDIQAQSTRDFVSIGKQYQQFVLLPPLPEQRRIVTKLDALQAEVGSLMKLQDEASSEISALIPSILDAAFRGELY